SVLTMPRVRTTVALAAAACAAAAVAGPARGDVIVERLNAGVGGLIGDAANDHVSISHDGGDGTLTVGQLSFGDPSIHPSAASGGAACTHDVVFNSVTCSGAQPQIVAVMGGGADVVRFSGAQATTCFAFTPPGSAMVAQVDLEGGDDQLSVDEDSSCAAGTQSLTTSDTVLDADGGTGQDTMSGGPFGDTMDGGSSADHLDGGDGGDVLTGGTGRDTLLGSSGIDVLSGGDDADVLSGGLNADTLAGGAGDDTLEGNGGDDTFSQDVTGAPDGADSMAGGSGTDTAGYSRRTGPVTVTVGNAADDGAAGEGDDVRGDVEHVVGGLAGDRLTGSAAAETLEGGPGGDVIDGGAGADTLNGGPGPDTIVAVDGVQDSVTCGPDADVAVLDLKDSATLATVTTRFGTLRLPDCEQITRQAVDDSAPGRPRGGRLALHGRSAVLGFSCPAAARPGCRGTLTLRDPATGRALGRARYSLAVGTRVTVRVPLTAAGARLLRRDRLAVVATVERGHSRIGPRGAEFRLRVAL
ncbi:MAG TPA: calcium-binding protein, partial [Miltoncostaea sp.]|nr:calcium-binding protein [Miltoncostaea sp.]